MTSASLPLQYVRADQPTQTFPLRPSTSPITKTATPSSALSVKCDEQRVNDFRWTTLANQPHQVVQTGTAQPETSKDSGTQPNGPPPRRRHRKLNSGVGRHVGSSSSENESHDKGRAGRAEVVVVGQLYPAPAPQLHARSCGSLTSTSTCLRQMHYMRLGCISRLALFN
ncbi:uncharacterized protein BKA78DRAFT_363426 [Phyllosticta capitalensis]|uniref:uncharacterized protein n=1 Tax=Phyllosticta capitalensis TaxID=121624 RepID=UPI0031319015